ncbi:bactericidal permeability-increasing protein-like [Orbicella faveolata]|uniref:bactericidal permeability-increasing protein-like n=1 Tax=Orbicella faveolata TaxID=48498 RepID=UPI0009E344A0|nr:bactericidal permeability-increasing protein-like [Orbicella faveolata]
MHGLLMFCSDFQLTLPLFFSWLYNLFDSYIDKKIKETLQDKLCQETSDLINNNAEKALSTFPVKKEIDKYALINYSLVSNPNFTESYTDIFIKGEFQSATAPKEAPFSPAPLPPDSESAKMVYVWVTDYLLNTAGLVYQDAGILNETVTPSMLPPNFSYPLNTNTFKLIIPKVSKHVSQLKIQNCYSLVTTNVCRKYQKDPFIIFTRENGHFKDGAYFCLCAHVLRITQGMV